MFQQLLNNEILIAGLVAWGLAQLLKVPTYYALTRRLSLGPMFSSGGMPSSHSALMTATTTAIGLYTGFDTPAFALAFALSMVVTYDAAGVRRQAGFHAEKINLMITELLKGHPISEERLKEVLGHTPRQVLVGSLFGIVVAVLLWLL
jgi:acid phosphatase family membrane protein YuiD